MSIANSTRAAKRKRGDEDVRTVPGRYQFQRDTEFWLEDGNLVLIAHTTGFRVYRGLLASQSEVFGGMFESASPSTGDSFDGCPVVHLSESPEDLRHLLRVILPASQRRFSAEAKDMSFSQLSAVARLAHKYNIADLETQASTVLQSAYVQTFADLEALQAFRELEDPGPADGNFPTFDDVCAIGAINYARLLDQPGVLPYAMYTCCGLGADILDGWTREDGTREHLSTEDLKRVVNGREKLAMTARHAFLRIFDPASGESPCSCEAALVELMMGAGLSEGPATHDVLSSWEPDIRRLCFDFDICQLCEDDLLARDDMERRQIWARLPEFFGLDVPGWSVLNQPYDN
ncbi:hypothetical protein C2E23DRAFT_722423 [Lenzites betulinus]|nr:hypothetical protein C2E23DRAFT_722423 [Lenzites betulinus]